MLCCETHTPPEDRRYPLLTSSLAGGGLSVLESEFSLAKLKSKDELTSCTWMNGVGEGIGCVGYPALQEFLWEEDGS